MAKQIVCRGIHGQPPSEGGGSAERVLVDRAWPEGIDRRDAPLDQWLRDVAPSAELQRWYGQDPRRFGEFRRRYLVELDDPEHRGAAARLRDLAEHNSLTLLTAAQDTDHSHAAVLAEWLTDHGAPDTERPDADCPDADPPDTERPDTGRPDAGDADPGRRPPGHRAAALAALADVNAGALAFVMGTGIVSTCLYANGADALSTALLWVALAGFAVLVPAYGRRLLRHRQRFVADLRPVQPKTLMTSVWIFMGAAAIAVLAGVRLVSLPPGSLLLSRPVVLGSSVVLWSFSSWLIPLLLALGVWRHAVRRVPLRYELGWWNLVFPVGMYAVTTHELGRATGTSWMSTAGRWEVWVAAGFWAVVFAAMAATVLRPRATAPPRTPSRAAG
ncbi:DUF488 family protein, N3 subclade [Streptomyces sp. NPDC054804]